MGRVHATKPEGGTVTDTELLNLAKALAHRIRDATDAMELQHIADQLSARDWSETEFERLLELIEENELPEPKPGTTVMRIGGPSRSLQFTMSLARDLRRLRPRI